MDKVSFLPEDYQKRRLQRRTNTTSIALFTVVMGAIVMAFAATDRQRSEVRAELAEVDEQFQEAAKRLEQLDELQNRKKLIVRKANVTAGLVEQVPRSLILAELVNHMPAEISLLDLSLKTTVVKARRVRRSVLDKAKDKKKKRGKKSTGQSGQEPPKIQSADVSMHLIGIAETDVNVAGYMQALGNSPMFKELNLVYSQELIVDKASMRKFRIDMELNQQVNPHQIKPLLVPRWNTPATADAGQVDDPPRRLTSVEAE